MFRTGLLAIMACLACSSLFVSSVVSASESKAECPSWLNYTLPQLHSDKEIDLCKESEGKTLILVNTASYCGYTKQFGGLEALHQEYKDKGLVVIGFPSDSFNQEADDEAKTAGVCYENFGVSFLMTSTINVKGKSAHPIFAHLAKESEAPSWNFNKYLVDKQGKVLNHFASKTKPLSKALTSKVEDVL